MKVVCIYVCKHVCMYYVRTYVCMYVRISMHICINVVCSMYLDTVSGYACSCLKHSFHIQNVGRGIGQQRNFGPFGHLCVCGVCVGCEGETREGSGGVHPSTMVCQELQIQNMLALNFTTLLKPASPSHRLGLL